MEFPKLKFDKQKIENIKLPPGSYENRGYSTTIFQPLSSCGNNNG